MHNYHDHITPSPFGPYPRKPANRQSSPTSAPKVESAGQTGDKKDDIQGKKVKSGPQVVTLVLHPTALSRHHEMIMLATTPLPDAQSSAQPPQTPLSASTPAVNGVRSQSTKRQKMYLEEKDYYNFEAELLLATEPPLLLDPAHSPAEAAKAIQMLKHPLHCEPAPEPKTRKRTHAEMAADDAQAAEEERRMLIMDERVKPSTRGGAGMAAAEGQTSSAALGFSRFKTLETIKQRHEENDRRKKEEEARQALEKRNHDAALAKRKILEDRQRAEHAATLQQQQLMMKKQQAMQQQQQAHAQHLAHNANNMPTNPQQQQLQQSSIAQHSSPVVRQQTPMMASSPLMPNAATMPMGGFPMQVTASNQGAGSPARPPSAAMQHINMARQMSQQHSQSRHATPQMAHNTPRMPNSGPADMNRQISATPHLQHRSPVVGMQGTPNQGMMNNTPQMNAQHLTPGQQMAILHKRQQMQQASMQNSPQGLTNEQMAMMRNQQQMALQQQQMNPQAYAAQMQRMQQMGNMQGVSQMQQMGQGQPQQLHNDPQALQRQNQMRQQQILNNQRLMQQMAASGQLPPARMQQMQIQQRNLQQQQMAAMRASQNLGDPANTDQYMANLRNQQALLARMQRGNQMSQQQNMLQAGGGQQNMQQMMMQQQQMQQQLRTQQSQQDLAQQFAAMQNALNRPGTGMG